MKVNQLFALAVIAFCGAFTSFAQTWTQTSAPATNWVSIVSSADGTKLIAAINVSPDFFLPPANPLFISTNSGLTWMPSGPTYYLGWDWIKIAASADCSQLLAAPVSGLASGPPLYISKDSGTTWYQTGPVVDLWNTDLYWASIASSPDGNTLVATAYGLGDSYNNGMIFISTNSGVDWTQANTAFDACASIVVANGGREMFAGIFDDSIYVSTNFGATWSATGSPSGFIWSVASSVDGSHLVASSLDYSFLGPIYTSKDSGVSWTVANAPITNW